jgi:hypothetical protein
LKVLNPTSKAEIRIKLKTTKNKQKTIMAYKQQGSPFQRNFGIGSPAKQMLKPRVAPVAAPVNAPVAAPVAPPVDPAMIAQAAKAVKGAMAPPPVDPGAEMPPPMQRNLRMEAESPMKFLGGMRRAVRGGRAARPKTARPKTAKPMSVGVGGFGGGGTTGSVNQPTTGGPQKGIVSTTPLPGGDKEGVKRTGRGGRRRGLLGSLARGVKNMGKAVRGSVGSGMSGMAKTAKVVEGARDLAKGVREKVGGLAKGAIKNNLGLAKGVAKAGLGGAAKLGGAVKAVKPVVRAAAGIAKGAGGLVSKAIKK